MGKVFKIYSVKILQNPNDGGHISYNELSDFITHILGLIKSNPADIINKLKYNGYSKLGNEKIYVYTGEYGGYKITVAAGNMGHFYVKIGSGEAGVYQSCNISFNNYIEDIKSVIR